MQGAQGKREGGADSTSSIVDDFHRYFDVDLATTEELRRKTYQIRYRVYCDEFKYEPADLFPDHAETDEYDDRSVHCLVTHKATGTPAGCVRLVCVDGDQLMPMEEFCGDAIDRQFLDSMSLPRSTYCEVSRLAVDGAFRRRAGEKMSRYGGIIAMDCSKREQRTFSIIAISVLLAGFAAGELIGRTSFVAMMEPFLPRMLRRSGVDVLKAGEETDYHGRRAPYFSTTERVVNGLGPDILKLYEAIRDRFAGQINELSVMPGPEAVALAPGKRLADPTQVLVPASADARCRILDHLSWALYGRQLSAACNV